jgi:Tfp pilus assembly protein PilO
MLVVIVICTGAFYFSNQILNNKIIEIRKADNRIKRQQEVLNSAKILNEQLQEVSKVIMNTMTADKFFSPDEVNSLVKRLADIADRYKIPVQSIVPKFIDAYGKFLIEQQYTVELECTYIQLGQFLSDIEAYESILKIRTLEVRPAITDKKIEIVEEMRYKITLQLSALKILKEA